VGKFEGVPGPLSRKSVVSKIHPMTHVYA
jgi:hypothetical protein